MAHFFLKKNYLKRASLICNQVWLGSVDKTRNSQWYKIDRIFIWKD